ncbi:uncharacterized protein LOC125864063 [Solanum stenotomum]|uniref:uncharacterized protein LOC125864063 n=1 Tax=Solanum stenotomum TaxID=172797 RepID=UPI0020D0AA56|nr:uncharacterized protein LOC125864063 [Solanum stenotomum]
MVADMRSRMSLFVDGLSHLSSKEGKVEEEKLRDREEFKNKRAKTWNKFGQYKSNANRLSFQQKQKGPTPSSASAPAPNNKNRDAHRGATLDTGRGSNRLYAITNRQVQEDSPDVVTDPGACLSFVTPYVAMNFDVIPD